MGFCDLILKKKDGAELTREEICYLVKGTVDGSIPDYQLSAFLMAVVFRGMTEEETASLTMEMAHSGDTVDLSELSHTVDKHSTGGVGDKTSLVVGPLAAAMGCTVAKMSGRGLGHTGGTIDKLESVPGLRTEMSKDAFLLQARQIGLVIAGQSGDLAPADKKLYALRDVTGTVQSLPLIVSSIMSKKLASGAKSIVLDVKTGKGAFMQTVEEAEELARAMVNIGNSCGRKTMAVISDMNAPLGNTIGNAIEVEEAMQKAEAMLDSGYAAECFSRFAVAQGAECDPLANFDVLPKANCETPVLAPMDGYVQSLDARICGAVSLSLGAGRRTKTDRIDPSAGIRLAAKPGDLVKKGDLLATLYSAHEADPALLLSAYQIGEEKPILPPLIHTKFF